MNFKEKVVIVTGASSGIGLACAKEFYRLGCNVVIAARNLEKLESLAKEFNCDENRCLPVKTDVSNRLDCQQLIEVTKKTYGRIDILINNAGISMRALFQDVKLEVLEKVMEVNFWGTVYCTKYALPHLLESKGVIVGVSSIAGFHGLPGRTAYSASKFAMQGFLESIRIENYKNNIQVIILSAGFTSSNIRKNALNADGYPQGETPLPEDKLIPPEKVAKNMIRSIRKRKRNRIMTLEGQLMVFAQRIIPRIVDRTIYNKFKKEPNSPF